jgi:biotin carboxyl carrier protein
MKFRLTVEGRSVEVEVGDLHTRPIVATVDGERFEVWPEAEQVTAPTAPPVARPEAAPPTSGPRRSRRTPGEAGAPAARAGQAVYAPLPGVVESVAVQPGDAVTVGQALCVLEAMKMKNVIRAARPGQIARVCVSPGQHVRHHDVLVEYADGDV